MTTDSMPPRFKLTNLMSEHNPSNPVTAGGMTPPMVIAQIVHPYVDQKILSMVRQSWEDAESFFREECAEFGIRQSDVFAKTSGWLDMEVSGTSGITLTTHEGAQSVNIEPLSDAYDNDRDYFPISCTDPVYSDDYWAAVEGATIIDIMLHRADHSSGRPNLRALSFKLDNGHWFAATYGIFRLPTALILCKYEEIEKTAPGLIVESISVKDPAIATTDWGAWDHA